LEGKNDNLIPETLRNNLRDAVSPSKKVVDFEGDHRGVEPDKAGLLQKIINQNRQWLVEETAVNPL